MRVTLFAALIGLVISAGIAYPDELPVVTVSVTPQSLKLCPGNADNALVVVENSGEVPARDVCLTFFANGPVETALPPAASDAGPAASADRFACQGLVVPLLPKGASFSERVSVKLTGYSVTDAVLHFQASYRFGAPQDAVQAVALGALTIHGQTLPDDTTMRVAAKLDFASLHEKRTGRLLVTIINGSGDYLVLERLAPSSLSFADLQPLKENQALPLSIPPRSTVVFGYEIGARDKIMPGTYLGFVDVSATTGCGIAIHRVADYTVTLGVFGQSELLTTLGIPSLLFLPGFLIVTLWMLLWRIKAIRVGFLGGSDADKFFVAAKEPEFWLLGITFSLLVFVFSRFLPGFGYQQAYQLSDIARLWGVSIGSGLVLYFLMLTIDRLHMKHKKSLLDAKAKDAAARVLTPDDSVLEALERIKLRNVSVGKCPRVESRNPAEPFWGFRLWSDNGGQTYWVIPPIHCKKRDDQLYYKLDPAGKSHDAEALLEALGRLEREGGAKIGWLKDGNLTGPAEKKPSEYSDSTKSFDFVVEG